jgi:hypothetical protein
MAKGAIAKQEVLTKLKEIFPDAFEYGKEFRIPMMEDGQRVEIKIALTCAKTNVGGDGDSVESVGEVPASAPASTEPTEEEKQNIADLMSKLGF